MPRSIAPVLLLTGFMAFGTPISVEAQFGGLIKRKVTEAVKGKPVEEKKAEDETKPPKQNEGSGFGSAIVELTQPSFDAVLGGLRRELDLQASFRKELAKYPTPEAYEQCKVNVATSPEGQKIMSALTNMPSNITGEEAQKRMLKMGEDMEALQKKRCPLDPHDWRSSRVREHLDSLREAVADSVTVGESSLSVHQYNVVLERVEFLCDYAFEAGAGSTTDSLDKKKDSPKRSSIAGPLKIQGSGKDIYWLYTADEVGVITPSNCKRYAALAKQLMK